MNSKPELPSELLYVILATTFAHCTHSVCFSQEDIEWELNALGTLSSVCRSFQAICIDICAKAFGAPAEGQSIASIVHPKLAFLRNLRKSARTEGPLQPISLDEAVINTPFLQAYLLLLGLLQLRKYAKSPLPVFIFKKILSPIQSSATVLEALCKRAQPGELYMNLYAAYHQQMMLVGKAVPTVCALGELELRLASLEACRQDGVINECEHLQEVIELGELLLKIEHHAYHYSLLADEASKFTGPEVMFYELPGMLVLLRRAYALNLENERDLIKTWANGVRERCKGCPSLREDASVPATPQEN